MVILQNIVLKILVMRIDEGLRQEIEVLRLLEETGVISGIEIDPLSPATVTETLRDAISIGTLQNAFRLETIIVTLTDGRTVISTVTVNVDLEIWTGLEDLEGDMLNLKHGIVTEILR